MSFGFRIVALAAFFVLLLVVFGAVAPPLRDHAAPSADPPLRRDEPHAPASAEPAGRTIAQPANVTLPPLPPVGTPLAQNFGDLLARSQRGDADAATRLYRKLARCLTAEAAIRESALLAEDALAEPTDETSTEAQRNRLDLAQRKNEAATRLKSLCAGVTDAMLGHLASATLQAARLGDAAARDCYVHRGPLANPADMIDRPESLGVYRTEIPALIEKALEQGDWKMVDMLAYAYQPGNVSVLGGAVGHDRLQHYRYLKLFRLGADAAATPGLDRRLDEAANTLAPEQRAEADAWAQSMFERHFSGVSTEAAPPYWNACTLPEL